MATQIDTKQRDVVLVEDAHIRPMMGNQVLESLPSRHIPYSQVDIAACEYAPHDAYGTADQGLWLRDVNVVADDSTCKCGS